jgi:hypothetical protein
MLQEELLDRPDRVADALDERKAVARIADRRRQNIREAHRAVVAQQQHVAVESAGNAGRKKAGAGNEVEPFGLVMGDGGARGRGPLAADHLGSAALHVVDDERHVAARTVEMRFDDLKRKRGRHRGIEGIPAPLQNAHSDRAGDPVGRGDNPERAVDLRAGCEAVGVDETHGTWGQGEQAAPRCGL